MCLLQSKNRTLSNFKRASLQYAAASEVAIYTRLGRPWLQMSERHASYVRSKYLDNDCSGSGTFDGYMLL
jgi:hypothetical protein